MDNTSRNINQEVIQARIIHRREENVYKTRTLTHVFPFKPHSSLIRCTLKGDDSFVGIAVFLPIYIAQIKRVLMVVWVYSYKGPRAKG